MIRITDDTLIIELPCSEPLEELCYLQEGICDVLSVIDFESHPNDTKLTAAMWQLSNLLRALVLSPEQSLQLSNAIKKSKELQKVFN